MRRRRGLPEPGQAVDFNQVQPDPSQVGGIAEAPFVRLPDPGSLFTARARRLRMLANGSPMAEYLLFLALLVEAQRDVVAQCPPPTLPGADELALRAEHGMPPLSQDQVRIPGELEAVVRFLLDRLDLSGAPDAARGARDRLAALPPVEMADLAAAVFGGAFPLDQVAESVFVAAALQVYLARLAAQLDPKSLRPPAEGVCPACGGAPVASVVVGWTQASKARYCACGLCGTLWNHIRIKCTACGSTEGVSYLTVEDGPKTVGVETCAACQSYIKHMQQHEDPALDPVADDVASYGLDLLVREDGFRRTAVNPLFLTG